MKRTNKCPKCGSNDIIVDAKAIGRSHGNQEQELSLATFRKPEALILKGQLNSTLSAWVYADCGYAEFYADSSQTLKVATA